MPEIQRNWAGNYVYSAARWHAPATLDELRELVARTPRMRVIGSRHSFNALADTDADMVSLARLDRVVALDRERHTVTVEGGIRYGQLGVFLAGEGFALHNMASLPHISVAGACATATHGSGDGNGNLATAVTALELVNADGELVSLSRERDGERFDGAVVGLGGLGVLSKLTLALEPAYQVAQDVYEQLPLAELGANFDAIMGHAYSVSLFTDWQGEHVSQVWLKRRVAAGESFEPPPLLFGAVHLAAERHPIAAMSTENLTPQRGVAGSWHERLPHFRMDYTPSAGAELQSEYFVPRQHAVAALRAVGALQARIAPLLLISEVRSVAADRLWMSPCYGQACVGIHFTWKPEWEAVRQLLPQIEAALAPFEARPHWGKLFTMAPEQVRARFPKLPEFRELLHAFDPRGKFRNAFLETYIFAGAT
jgi:alditol oxidase